MRKIAVLLGGNSSEREVSLVSGAAIAQQLESLGYSVLQIDPAAFSSISGLLDDLKANNIDIVFNGLHGGDGENGKIQAALSLAGIKCTGSDYKSSCIAMDKFVSKLIASEEGIPVPDYVLLRDNFLAEYKDDRDLEGIANKLGMPIVVKPNDGGSSVGTSIVHGIGDIRAAVELGFRYGPAVLLERFIPGQELTATILTGEALPLVEIKPVDGWYDYASKYTKGKTVYVSPAEIDDASSHLMQTYALRLWKALGCSGYARFDFRFDGQKAYFLEANTLPGMTSLSLTPMAAKARGISFGELLETIVNNVK